MVGDFMLGQGYNIFISMILFALQIKLYTKHGTLKYQTDCAPNNGYFMIPLYDKVHKPMILHLRQKYV